ncbi:hypothetical protein JCM10213_002897 [Rhodosporidiobolus nylandii]
MSRPSTSSSGVAQPPATTAITRSMSRKSLAAAQLEQDGAGLEGYAVPTLPTRATGLPRSRTTSSLSSSSLPRSRTASALSFGAAGSAKTTLPASTRPRRVLADSVNTRPTSADHASANTALKSPPTKRGRLSRAEAGQMTGMGVVRAGPAVAGQRRGSASPVKRAASSSSAPATRSSSIASGQNDPFSTQFVRPTFEFETSSTRDERQEQRVVKPLPSEGTVEGRRRRALSALPEENADERMDDVTLPLPSLAAAGPFDLTSPKKRSAPSSVAMERSSAHFGFLAVPDTPAVDTIDVDGASTSNLIPIAPSSPFRGALSPRALTGKPYPSSLSAASTLVAPTGTSAGTTGSLRRKLDEISSSDSANDEDELDFLSPRKKAKPSSSAPHVRDLFPSTSSASSTITARPQPGLRSPPPKKKLPSSSAVRASVRAAARTQPSSAAMQRSVGAGRAPFPDLTSVAASKLPRSQPQQSLAAPTSTAPVQETTNRILPPSLTGPTASAGGTTRSTRSMTAQASAPSGAAAPATAAALTGSRLPRRVLVAAPAGPSTSSSSTNVARPPTPGEDSMVVDPQAPPPSLADASVSSVSFAGVGNSSTRSEETARRLANLQSMLSRLQMPASRRTSGGGNTSLADTSMASTVGGQKEYEVPIAPPAEGPSSTSSGPGLTRRTSLPRRVSGGGAPVASLAPQPVSAPAPGRRRSSTILSRPAGGIVNTSLAMTGNISLSSQSAPQLSSIPSGSSSRRVSGGAGNSSMSLDSSAILSASSLAQEAGAGQGKSTLRGVVAFVDVRTAEGDDSGMIFVDMLRGMGARVTTRPSSLTTHIIYKSGRPSTLSFLRTLPPMSRPKVVGIAWVVRCAEVGQRVDEGPFKVEDVEGEKENRDAVARTGEAAAKKREVGAMAQAALEMSNGPGAKGAVGPNKRRRSMEPKALAALNQSANASAAADNALKASIAASIERARRKSLQYAPKVGSPLAKRTWVLPDAPVDEEE